MSEFTDPTRATSPNLKRGVFVGIGAAGATFGGSIVAALAAGEGFGKPHPPVVAEDDPAVTAAAVTLTHGARTIDAYTAMPHDPTTVKGGVVVVQAIWGIDAQLRDVVRRFAKQGYTAIAPGLYSGMSAPSADGATDYTVYRTFAGQLVPATVAADLLAGRDWAKGHNAGKVGITGFCMGGGIALRQTVASPNYDAAAIWYGPVAPVIGDASDISAPLLGSYGGRDTSIPVDDVHNFERALTDKHNIKIYDDAGHAFFDDTRSSYVASAAADAWTRTLAWFAKYLHG